MSENIKTNFTEEEIKQYIEDLNSAIGNKEKLDVLLGFDNLPIFISYLRKMGVNETLLSYAGVVEIARQNFKGTLASEYFKREVTDKGIMEEDKKDGFKKYHYVDENGILHMHGVYEFSMPDKDGKVFYYSKRRDGREYVENEIDKNGLVKLTHRFHGGDGWYTEERKDENGVPVIEVDTTDGATFGRVNKYIDTGYVYFLESEMNRSYKQNYEMYTTLFPNTKEWFDEKYRGTVDGISERLEIESIKLKIKELKGEIKSLKTYKSRGIDKNLNEKRNEVKSLLGFLLTVKEKSPVGKKAVEDILNEVKQVQIPQKEEYKMSSVYIDPLDGEDVSGIDINEEDIEIDESGLSEKEKLEMEKRRLIKKVLQLRNDIVVGNGKTKYYDDIINLVSSRVKQIPVIGKTIEKIARKNIKCDYDDIDDIVL